MHPRYGHRAGDGQGDRDCSSRRAGFVQRSGTREHVQRAAPVEQHRSGKFVMTRILVVEDEPGIALGLEDDLRLEGWEVEVAPDGKFDLPALEAQVRSEEHTSELQSLRHLVCRLLLEKKKKMTQKKHTTHTKTTRASTTSH